MTKVIGVRFKSSARIYYFDPAGFTINVGDGVIVETARGQEFGDVAQGITEVEDTMIVSPLKPVLRLASEQDKSMREQNSGKEEDAFAVCTKKIEQHGLDMKLVDVEYSFNGSKVVFYFTADERVDFRELVKDLASQFRTRIELRQIGVRDEAKMLGGLGSCGRPVCCKTFLDDFRPVSIKMAKEQNLSLSPTKISGLCGRLMCCLQYEQAGYEEMKKKMPKTGREVVTPDGTGIALENNSITEKTRVRVTLPDGTIDMREYHYTLLCKPGEPLPEAAIRHQEEQARAAAEAKAEAAAKAAEFPMPASRPRPQQPSSSGDAPQEDRSRRRRRGGHGRGNGQGGAEGQNKPASAQPAAQGGQQPRKQQPNRQPQKDAAQPQKEQPQQGDKPRPRRRRRSGGNRNGNGGAPEGTPNAPKTE